MYLIGNRIQGGCASEKVEQMVHGEETAVDEGDDVLAADSRR